MLVTMQRKLATFYPLFKQRVYSQAVLLEFLPIYSAYLFVKSGISNYTSMERFLDGTVYLYI